MRATTWGSFFILATAAFVQVSHAQNPRGAYVAGGITYTMPEDASSVVPDGGGPGVPVELTVAKTDGWGGFLALGYDLGVPRFEVELGYTDDGTESFTIGPPVNAFSKREGASRGDGN